MSFETTPGGLSAAAKKLLEGWHPSNDHRNASSNAHYRSHDAYKASENESRDDFMRHDEAADSHAHAAKIHHDLASNPSTHADLRSYHEMMERHHGEVANWHKKMGSGSSEVGQAQ